MRINGLVREFNRVRSRLQAGLDPDDVAGFRKHVTSIVQQVETILQENGISPEHLPAPSRMAYSFLRQLDLDTLPVVRNDQILAATTLKLKNVVRIGDHFAQRLWQELDQLATAVTLDVGH